MELNNTQGSVSDDDPTNSIVNTSEMVESDLSSDSVLRKTSLQRQGPRTVNDIETILNKNQAYNIDDDQSEHFYRLLDEAEQTLSCRNIVITMLQDQLKKIENLYKNNLDETQDLRYKYCSTTQELSNLKKICKKYEDDINSLLSEREKLNTSVNVADLQNEEETWKIRYEELSKTIQMLENYSTSAREASNHSLNKQNQNTMQDDGKAWHNIEDILRQQNKNLDFILTKLDKDLQQLANRQQHFEHTLSITQTELIEITGEARTLRVANKTCESGSSIESLQEENKSLKSELEQIANGEGQPDLKNSKSEIQNLKVQLQSYDHDNKKLAEENEALKERLGGNSFDQEAFNQENAKMKQQIISEGGNQKKEKQTLTSGEDFKVLLLNQTSQTTEDSEYFRQVSVTVSGKHTSRLQYPQQDENSVMIQELRRQNSKIKEDYLEAIQAHAIVKAEITRKILQVNEYETKIDNLEKQVSDMKIKLNKSHEYQASQAESLVEKGEKITKCECKINTLMEKNIEISMSLEQLKNEKKDLNAKVKEFSMSLCQCKDDLVRSERETQILTKREAELENELHSVCRSRDAKERQYCQEVEKSNDLAKTKNELQTENTRLQEIVREKEMEVKTLKNKINELEKMLHANKEEFVQLLNTTNEKEQELKKLKNGNKSLQKELELKEDLMAKERQSLQEEQPSKEQLDLNSQLEQKNSAFSLLEQQYNDLLEKLRELGAAVERLIVENAQLKSSLEKLAVERCNSFQESSKEILVKKTSLCSCIPDQEVAQESTTCVCSHGMELASCNICYCKNIITVCTNETTPSKNFEVEELQFKRNYLIKKVESIDKKLNNSETIIRATKSKSTSDLQDETKTAKEVSRSASDKQLQDVSNLPNEESNANNEQNNEQWKTILETVQQLALELEEVKVKLGDELLYSKPGCSQDIDKQLSDLREEIKATSNMEDKIEELKQQMAKHQAEMHSPLRIVCRAFPPSTTKRKIGNDAKQSDQNLQRQLSAGHQALNVKSVEQERLRQGCQNLTDVISKKNDQSRKPFKDTPDGRRLCKTCKLSSIPAPSPPRKRCSCIPVKIPDQRTITDKYKTQLNNNIRKCRAKSASPSLSLRSSAEEAMNKKYLIQ